MKRKLISIVVLLVLVSSLMLGCSNPYSMKSVTVTFDAPEFDSVSFCDTYKSNLSDLMMEFDNVEYDYTKGPIPNYYLVSVDDYVNGDDDCYWMLYVDGEMSNVGAADVHLKDGSTYSWKFEQFSY